MIVLYLVLSGNPPGIDQGTVGGVVGYLAIVLHDVDVLRSGLAGWVAR